MYAAGVGLADILKGFRPGGAAVPGIGSDRGKPGALGASRLASPAGADAAARAPKLEKILAGDGTLEDVREMDAFLRVFLPTADDGKIDGMVRAAKGERDGGRSIALFWQDVRTFTARFMDAFDRKAEHGRGKDRELYLIAGRIASRMVSTLLAPEGRGAVRQWERIVGASEYPGQHLSAVGDLGTFPKELLRLPIDMRREAIRRVLGDIENFIIMEDRAPDFFLNFERYDPDVGIDLNRHGPSTDLWTQGEFRRLVEILRENKINVIYGFWLGGRAEFWREEHPELKLAETDAIDATRSIRLEDGTEMPFVD